MLPMLEKRKLCVREGTGLTLCDEAQKAYSDGFVDKQVMRQFESIDGGKMKATRETRTRLALVKSRSKVVELLYCPWCGRDIDTKREQAVVRAEGLYGPGARP